MIDTEKGNVLFLILIAVVLFAALSYTVTQSSRDAGETNSEKLELKASEIIQYATQVKVTADRLRIINKCELTELSFQADWNGDGQDRSDQSADQANTTSPPDGRCRFFHKNGGDMPFIKKPSWLEDSDFKDGYRLHGKLAVAGHGSDTKSELIFGFRLQPTASNLELCNAYNRVLGLPENLSDQHNAQFFSYFSWTGSFSDGNGIAATVGDSATELYAQSAGCYNATGYDSGGYVFYNVIASR